jgi:ComEC/Rec2-related protein
LSEIPQKIKMKHIRALLNSIYGIFPGLPFWTRLPALMSWIAVSCGIAASSLFPIPAHNSLLYTTFSIAATVSLLAGVFSRLRTIQFCGFLLFSIFLCTLRQNNQEKISRLLSDHSSDYHTITGSITSLPVKSYAGYKFLLKIDSASFDNERILISRHILCISPTVPPMHGTLRVFGKCAPGQKRLNRYDFDELTWLNSNGISAKMSVDSMEISDIPKSIPQSIADLFRNRVFSVLDRFTDQSHRAVLLAAFLNEREHLSAEINTAYRKSGIFHLLSISGLHAGMILAAAYVLLGVFPVNAASRHVLSLLVLWSYQLFIGFIPSLFRATLMATLIIVCLLFQKKSYSLQSLGLAGTVWLILSPESLFMPGYQLSFAATFGIIALQPLFSSLCPRLSIPIWNSLVKWLYSTFSVSFAGFISTAPVLLYHFGTLSIYGLIANLAAVGLMSICMWSFFASLVFESLIQPLSSLAVIVSSITLSLINCIAGLSNKIRWSEIALPVPPAEIILLYTVIIIAFILADRRYVRVILSWTVPLFLLIIPISFLLRLSPESLTVERFYTKGNSSVTAVKWPHRGVWLFCDGNEKKLASIYRFSIQNWIRHNPLSFVEKAYLIEKSPRQVNSLFTDTQEKTGNLITSFRQSANERLFRKTSPCSCVFSVDGKDIRLICADKWVNFSLKDSLVRWGDVNTADTSISEIPIRLTFNRRMVKLSTQRGID